MKKGIRYLVFAITALMVFGVSGCGVSHKSPEGVVEALVKEYVNGKEKKVKDCYGQKKDTEKSLQEEIDAAIKYFKAHNADEVEIRECEILSETEKAAYVYITYDLVLENEQKYPCISTYMVGKEEKEYYVLPASKITAEMSKQAAADYAKFMTTDSYKQYTRDYETFMKKNPGYEDKIAAKLS